MVRWENLFSDERLIKIGGRLRTARILSPLTIRTYLSDLRALRRWVEVVSIQLP